ncbi:MAG: (Fe-S)-binding protein [Gammaproteobacteria bacterium]
MALADQCVRCGLCLPHCPTYRLSALESESPRGRIALLQGLAGGRLKAEGGILDHLENCVGCRACEAVCPAQVPFGQIMDAGRELVPDRSPRLLNWLARHPALIRWSLVGVGGLRRLGLVSSKADRPSGWIRRSLRRMPLPSAATPPASPCLPDADVDAAGDDARGRVKLFTGCISRAMDPGAQTAIVSVLSRLGYRVEIPAAQACCGALDQHAGRAQRTRRLARRNSAAFGADDTPVLSMATGCTATLLDYARLDPDADASIATRVQDISGFLFRVWDPEQLPPGRLRARVALHLPCTARNVTDSADATAQLLARIPGLQIHQLDTAYGCCGAAGHHFLTRPGQADALLAPLLQQIEAIRPDYVVTSNIGCALHIGGGIAAADASDLTTDLTHNRSSETDSGSAMPKLVHPAQLVLRALETGDSNARAVAPPDTVD